MALGLVHPDQVKRNAGAQAGDVLVLGKPLGVGIYRRALKKDALDAGRLCADDRQHDAAQHARARALAEMAGVHALTDVTGFGLLGHLLEIAAARGCAARVRWARLPVLPGVARTGGAGRRHRRVGPQLGGLRRRT